MIYGSEEFIVTLTKIIKDGLRHPLYEDMVAHANAMAVHIMGDKPIYLLERTRPREDEAVKLYRIENYEPTTKAGADKALSITGKIFNPSLSSVQWPDPNTATKELETYTMKEYPKYNTIQNYNKEVVLQKMIADPNGLLAVRPEDLPDDDTQKPKPVVVCYGSAVIWWFDKDCYLMCVYEPEKNDKDLTHTFEYYDKTQYIEFDALYNAADKSLTLTLLQKPYPHNFGKIPAWFLGGKIKPLDNGATMYLSFFEPALAHWNLAVTHESDLVAAFVNHMHPQKWEMTDDCAYKETIDGISYPCRSGWIQYPGPNKQKMEHLCPVCGGSGQYSVKSPFEVYQFNKSKLDEGMPMGAPVGYITIPVHATQMLEVRAEKMIQKGMWAINMDIEEKIGENQSGVAKTIDRSAQNDTLFEIASRIFDVHLHNEFKYIDGYMNSVEAQSTGRESNNQPVISKPTKFELLSSTELIYNYKVALDSGMDKNYLRFKAIEIINRDLSTAPDMKNYLIDIVDLDPLYGFSLEELGTGVDKGVIRKEDWVIHDNIKTFIDRANVESKGFQKMERKDKIVILEGYADELLAATKMQISVDVIPPDDFTNAE